jgi:hypothetical protein
MDVLTTSALAGFRSVCAPSIERGRLKSLTVAAPVIEARNRPKDHSASAKQNFQVQAAHEHPFRQG